MKKLKFIAVSVGMAATAMAYGADDNVVPAEWPEVWAQTVSTEGKFVGAQDVFLNCYTYDVLTGSIVTYQAVVSGDGTFLANNGTMVGEGITGQYGELSLPCLMRNGDVIFPDAVSSYPAGAFESITPDARYAVGYVGSYSNPVYQPVVYDLEAETLEVLPFPRRDFFGGTPQGIICHVVSDDGNTIGGIVIDGTGFFNYPIVYTRDGSGKWSYTLPTESMFNPEGKDLPRLPPTPSMRPGDEGGEEAWNEYSDALDRYWEAMDELGANQNFGGKMVMSGDGSTMLVCKFGGSEEVFAIWSFDIESGSYGPLPSPQGSNLIPTQVLPDGTVVALSSPSDFIPYTAWMLLPGADEFTLFSSWLDENLPDWYPWLEDTLGQHGVIGYEDGEPLYGDYIVTGQISFSADKSVIAGGLPVGDMLSYIYGEPAPSSGIGSALMDEPESGSPAVWYNLQGIPVEAPTRGIYIVNGKKVLVN